MFAPGWVPQPFCSTHILCRWCFCEFIVGRVNAGHTTAFALVQGDTVFRNEVWCLRQLATMSWYKINTIYSTLILGSTKTETFVFFSSTKTYCISSVKTSGGRGFPLKTIKKNLDFWDCSRRKTPSYQRISLDLDLTKILLVISERGKPHSITE